MNDPQLLRIIAYCCWGLAALSLLLLLCSLNKVRIATTVIKTTAEFTRQQCQTILVPIFMFIAIVFIFIIINRQFSLPFGLSSLSIFSVQGKFLSAMALPMPALTGMLELKGAWLFTFLVYFGILH